jgi:heat shock protein HslJ
VIGSHNLEATMPRTGSIVLLGLLTLPTHSFAQPSLICFGNEPSWSVDLTTPGTARLTVPGEESVTYQGRPATLPVLGETMWRGSAAGLDLVVFLRDEACSDGMSDIQHPVSARVSLADGRFFVGCCRVPAGATSAQPSLEGTTWRLAALTGQTPEALAASPMPLTARFEGGRVSGFSGCNRFTGGYATEEGRLTIGALAGTMMACAPPVMAIEKAFRDAFSGTLRYAVSGSELRLTADSGTVLSFEKDSGRLEGASWVVTGYNNGRSGVVSPVAGSRITLTFSNGMVSGTAGCNTFRAAYSTEGSRITIQPAVTTRKACGDEVMAQERQFLAALQSSVTFRVEGGTLDMHRQDGERAIHATAAP